MPTPIVYDQFKLKQHNGNAINLATATIKVMILTNGYVPSMAHAFKSDLTNEVTGTGYTAGGQAIAGVSLALDTGVVEWVHTDPTWTQNAAGFSNGRYAVWYEDTGVAGTSKVIMYLPFGADAGNVASDFILDGSATTGVLNFG